MNYSVFAYFLSQFFADFYGPDVFAFDTSENVVRTLTYPTERCVQNLVSAVG